MLYHLVCYLTFGYLTFGFELGSTGVHAIFHVRRTPYRSNWSGFRVSSTSAFVHSVVIIPTFHSPGPSTRTVLTGNLDRIPPARMASTLCLWASVGYSGPLVPFRVSQGSAPTVNLTSLAGTLVLSGTPRQPNYPLMKPAIRLLITREVPLSGLGCPWGPMKRHQGTWWSPPLVL